MAATHFAQCDDDLLLDYAFNEAVRALSIKAPERALTLAHKLLQRQTMVLNKQANAIIYLSGVTADEELLDALEMRVLESDAIALEIEKIQLPSQELLREYYDVKNGIRLLRDKFNYKNKTDEFATEIALLDYVNAGSKSTNVGDYTQTLAVMGLLSQFKYAQLVGDTDANNAMLFVQSHYRKDKITVNRPVRFLNGARDDLTGLEKNTTVFIPIFGWFARKPFEKLNIPFPRNVFPLFFNIHVNDLSILTPDTIEFLKAWEPIGCRDWPTVRILDTLGVKVFFAGCPTSALNRLFKPTPLWRRRGRFTSTYRLKHSKGMYRWRMRHATKLLQLDKTIPFLSFSKNIRKSYNYIDKFKNARIMKTPLLHTYIPCRSLNVPVEFTNKKLGDARFEGLIDSSHSELSEMADRFELKFRDIFEVIFDGKNEHEVRRKWLELCKPEIEFTKKRLAEEKLSVQTLMEKRTAKVRIPKIPFVTYQNGQLVDGSQNSDCKRTAVALCFDKNLLEPSSVTIENIIKNSKSPLNIICITRKVGAEFIEGLSRQHANCQFEWFDVTQVRYGNLRLLPHTSLSTMDRLYLPDWADHHAIIIYVDVDLLVRGDISDLADCIGNKAIAARESENNSWSGSIVFFETTARNMDKQRAKLFRQFVAATSTGNMSTFNAGVLVMNTTLWKKNNWTAQSIAIAQEFGVHDQIALNLCVNGEFEKLDSKWNHFYSNEICENPHIVHFVGPNKPWNSKHLPFSAEWNSRGADKYLG